jgi:mono/diheme cytochrome c family protein
MKYAGMVMTLMVAAVIFMASPALAAELTGADQRYLRAEYGIGRHDEPLSSLTVAQQKQLHALINVPKLKDVPAVRHDRVAAYLYDVHMRQCQNSAASHPGLVCPPAANAAIEPGKEVADRQCNFCHLFGAGQAPPFRKLARQQSWAGNTLAEAQRQGHEHARRNGRQMSPVALTGEQFDDLAAYVNSLK